MFLLERLLLVGGDGVRVRPLGGGRSGEMRITRFLRNTRVTPGEIFASASVRTQGLVAGRHILAIQDSTTLRDDGKQASLLMHPTIAVDAQDGALLGLVHAEMVHRSGGRKDGRKTTPFVQKQSHRWLDAAHMAARLAQAGRAARVTVIADREGDIYEEFAWRPPEVDLLIRAAQDRRLGNGQMLFGFTDGLAELGRVGVDLPAAPGRAARTARIALRASAIRIIRPGRPAAQKACLPPEMALYVVDAREIDPPPGVPPAHWRLLTTHTVASLADARQIMAFYRERWTIEQLFRTCKTKGFNIEAVRIAQTAPFENLAAATLIAAIQVLQLVRDRDGTASRPMGDVFGLADQPALALISASLEGKTARQRNPHPPASLAFASWICARLGGWTGYYGKPGPIVMLSGLLRLNDMLQARAIKVV